MGRIEKLLEDSKDDIQMKINDFDKFCTYFNQQYGRSLGSRSDSEIAKILVPYKEAISKALENRVATYHKFHGELFDLVSNN
jgi:hypothetical protein